MTIVDSVVAGVSAGLVVSSLNLWLIEPIKEIRKLKLELYGLVLNYQSFMINYGLFSELNRKVNFSKEERDKKILDISGKIYEKTSILRRYLDINSIVYFYSRKCIVSLKFIGHCESFGRSIIHSSEIMDEQDYIKIGESFNGR